jgi:hypothetical protein
MFDQIDEETFSARSPVWPPVILALKEEMVTFYWSRRQATARDARKFFYA